MKLDLFECILILSFLLMYSHYPSQRQIKDKDSGENEGVMGTTELLNTAIVAEQPVASFDWNTDKLGLVVFAAFDQTVRVGIITKLNLY